MAENEVPMALVQIVRAQEHTEIHLEAQANLPVVCWYATGESSPYLLAQGHRYRYLGGEHITTCPTNRGYAKGEVMVLRFQPLDPRIAEFSLVEGQGGENQMIDKQSSSTRFWNFVRINLR